MSHFLVLRREASSASPVEIPVPVRWRTLAEAVYLSGLFTPPALCSGLGHCGRCRVRFLDNVPEVLEADRQALGHHALDAGWRLSCIRPPEPGMRIELPEEAFPQSPINTPAPAPKSDQKAGPCAGGSTTSSPLSSQELCLAVDLGTTSLHWRFLDPSGKSTDALAMVNPQMGAGSDVISRIAHALEPEERETLSDLVRGAIRRIIGQREVTALCVAANPAMTAIFLNRDVSGLARAPYRLDFAGGSDEQVDGLPPVWIPPQISPFVGGDITAGFASLALDPDRDAPAYPFLLADLGTNGEFILALSPQEALAASVPMGPALEGINLSCGMEAGHGAVTAFGLTPLGLEPLTMGETAPRGISGTGYLSLLQCLLRTGFLSRDGSFTRPSAGSLAARMARPDGDGSGMARIRLPGRLYLSASDVEELLKVKAAFSLAVSSLLREASLPASSLKALYLAGALGEHLPEGSLEELGFIPPGSGARVTAVGNTSLSGAALLLRHPQIRPMLRQWAATVRPLDLALSPNFGSLYADHMTFAWKG